MIHARTVALAVAALFAAGCSSGSSVTPPAQTPAQSQPQSGAQYPVESSAARTILARVGTTQTTSRSPQNWGGGDDDDGGWSELTLPILEPCGNGTFSNKCSAWMFGSSGGGSQRSGARSAQSVVGGTPPALNFCRDGGLFPSDLGPPQTAPQLLGATYSFSLSYVGTRTAPIVTFATRWWNVNVTGSFAGSSTSASAIGITPLLTTGASRGWLAFFTWSWPADIMLVPYDINEIQLAASSVPLTIPAGGSASLGAFDCLGRPIAARVFGTGFGFNHALTAASASTATSELNVPVYAGARPNGFVYLTDDRGAMVADPVAAAPTPTPAPTPVPTPKPTSTPRGR